MKEMVGGCCVCSDERGWPDNPLVYCDGHGCTVAVHQACYGIVTVPTGPWYCKKCESSDIKGKVRCELCPSKSGALKRSDTGGWAHVVCALYIPEVRFGNVSSMEPIVLRLIPSERYNKTCYICQDAGKTHRATAGACMQCNKSGCRQQFHVTCAQSLGLLCEEAGNYLDNVKYCGYCQHHYSKLKKGGNVKTIPPYKPVTHDSNSSDSSGEKEADDTRASASTSGVATSSAATGSAATSAPATSAAGPSAPGLSAAGAGGGTPTHKNKGPGRKSSTSTGKTTPSTSKTPTNALSTTPQPPDKGRKSPSRRASTASDGAGGSGGSKNATPAPSPQHAPASDQQLAKASGGSTPGSVKAPTPSPAAPAPAPAPLPSPVEPVGVISSVASANAAAASSAPTSVVKTHESVITNTDSVETKQTKKRKAVAAAAAAAAGNETKPAGTWESHVTTDVTMEKDKIVKKAKTQAESSSESSGDETWPPLPPGPNPYLMPTTASAAGDFSPMPGPSGLNQAPNIRSPSNPQGPGSTHSQPHGSQGLIQGQRAGEPASLLVSVPIPLTSTSQGLNLKVSGAREGGSSLFYQVQKQISMSQNPGYPQCSPRDQPIRRPAPMSLAYKPMASGTKDASTSVGAIRTKKRAAMAAAAANIASTIQPTGVGQGVAGSMAGARRGAESMRRPEPQTVDSPPSSPGSEQPLKPKIDNSRVGIGVPHMLGNELNPESGAAARLQEQLTAEIAAHAAAAAAASPFVPPPLLNKAAPGSSRGGLVGIGSSSAGTGAQSLDQLLERQWEQGSQFLMEQAQHFDIASLLSCLHQLRTENVRLEEHVGNLLQRRDHLLAVNARLAIPLTHHNLSSSAAEQNRNQRENGGQMRAPPGPPRTETITSDRSHQMMVRDTQQKPS